MRLPLLALAMSVATPAAAHMVFAEPQAPAGSYYAGFLRVTHGCGNSGTRSVRVEIPAGITSARPQPKPGWTLTTEHQTLATPIKTEGGQDQGDRVSAIVWTGSLPADEFDQFGIMMKLPDGAGPLYFPTTQTCETGVNAWTHIPASPEAWHATPFPAPMLILTTSDMTGMHMTH